MDNEPRPPAFPSSSPPPAPWWSTPDRPTATAVQPPYGRAADDTPPTWSGDPFGADLPPAPEVPPGPPPQGPASRAGWGARRPGAAVLVAAVLAGALGGGLAAAGVDRLHGAGSVPFSVSQSGGTLPAAAPAAPGTPEAAAAAIGPSVVTVEVSGSSALGGGLGGFGGQAQPVSDTGSGVILRADGYILTNNHVVAAAENGGTVNVTLSTGTTLPAKIVGYDATSDLAVIKVSGASGLKPAVFADSRQLKVGQTVLAVGAPLGLSNTVTEGIVSTLHRPVATGQPGAGSQAVIDAVQTDAAINPGNSGGALVDLAGRVVGINSAIATTGGSPSSGTPGNIGVGFAIPSDQAAKVANELIATGHATHSQVGISVTDAASTTTGAPGLGAVIRQVSPGGPAAAAGLQPGDVITKVDNRLVTGADSLIVAIRAHDPGTTVTITFTRNGSVHTAQVKLAGVTS